MRVYILWGFLGSGKTTLINHLLTTCLAGKKVVVVENESGKESVDSLLLRSKEYRVRDLSSGCICCTLRTQLPQVMDEIETELSPEIMLIEPSGLASLEELIQIPGIRLDGILSLIDVHMYPFLKRLNPDFYRRQFRLSPVILLTKTEGVEDSQVRSVVNELLSIQPRARIVSDYQLLDKGEWEQLWLDSRSYGSDCFVPVYPKATEPVYETWMIPVGFPLDIYFLEKLFNRVNKSFPDGIVRAKGIMRDADGRWGKMDFVNGKVSFERISVCEELQEKEGISFWWYKSQAYCPIDWISAFINAVEIACPMEALQIENEELYAYLGFKESSPDDYTRDFIERLKEEAVSVCHPRFGYRLMLGEQVDKRSLKLGEILFTPDRILVSCLRDSDFFAMITATVGKELDEWLDTKRSGNDVMEAFVADALGSVIVEAVIAWGLALVEKKMKDLNLRTSNSYSPGYCGWDVVEQRAFFSLLPPAFCGISLTDSCLMLPVKSVSALVGIGEKVEKKPYGCSICRKKDCFKRKEVGTR